MQPNSYFEEVSTLEILLGMTIEVEKSATYSVV